MKYYIISYVVASDDFWTGVDFYNPADVETGVKIQVQRYSNGTISNNIEVVVGPKLHYILAPTEIAKNLNEPDGRAALLITCSDNVMITPANNWGGVLIPKEVESFE